MTSDPVPSPPDSARRDGVVRSLRRARKIAARMLAEQRKRDATRAEERFS